MRAGGIDIDAALKNGSLAVINKKDAYLKNGYFDPDEMIQFLADSTKLAKKEGYSALRVTGEMTWMPGREKGNKRLIEYEAKLSRFFPKYDCSALCQYSRHRFSSSILLDVIRTHPLVIVGSTVCKNFYQIPVEEFFKEGRGTAEEVDRMLKNLIDRERIEDEKKEAEGIIRENEAELREAQRIGHFGNFDWDARTDVIKWSDEYYRIYGFKPGTKPPGYEEHLKTYSPETAAQLDAAVKNSMQTGEPYVVDIEQVVRPDGLKKWITARGEVKRDKNNKIIGLRGTAQDITERKLAEVQLKKQLDETTRVVNLLVGREFKMTELKKELAYLKSKLENK
jgi:PAS domain S-box-containing protein